MELFLVRHGEAEAKEVDSGRPLTAQGREEVDRVAREAVRAGILLTQILHSGKLRARQTAEIFAERLGATPALREAAGLAPLDEPDTARRMIEKMGGPLMLVGHLPHLSRLVSLLLLGDPGREIVVLGTGAMICLAREDRDWRLRWLLPPEMAGE